MYISVIVFLKWPLHKQQFAQQMLLYNGVYLEAVTTHKTGSRPKQKGPSVAF